jgi:two-component system chemotaxis response regulator CheB
LRISEFGLWNKTVRNPQSAIRNGVAMIQVLIVDDSPTLRRVIRSVLESDPELQVVGEARNGEEAIALCDELQPDIITMDIQMPVMDGYQAIGHIMAESPRPILVLTTSDSDRQLGVSFKAIELGALYVAGKPKGPAGVDPEADKLIASVKAMAGVKVVGRRPWLLKHGSEPPIVRPAPRPSRSPVGLIAIGASTGGPPALQAILSELKAGLSVPVVVVQHISPGFVRGLARWLNQTTPLQVKLAEAGECLRADRVYVAPDGQHLLVRRRGLASLKDDPKVDGHRPSVTALFESVARTYGSSAVGVLLTGMGSDGAQGLKMLREAGGHTIVQDKDTCVVFGMPKQAIALGAAIEVLPLGEIGRRLVELVAPHHAHGGWHG